MELWKLDAEQRPLTVRHLVFSTEGDQQAAFAWTLDAADQSPKARRCTGSGAGDA